MVEPYPGKWEGSPLGGRGGRRDDAEARDRGRDLVTSRDDEVLTRRVARTEGVRGRDLAVGRRVMGGPLERAGRPTDLEDDDLARLRALESQLDSPANLHLGGLDDEPNRRRRGQDQHLSRRE